MMEMETTMTIDHSRPTVFRLALSVSFGAVLMALLAAPARAQNTGDVVRPFACLPYSLTEANQPGPFARQAPPAGCAIPSDPLTAGVRAIVPAGRPTDLTAKAEGRTIVLRWMAGAGTVRSYLVYAGTSSGLVNVAKFDTESALPTLTLTDAPNGTFFFRVLAQTDNGISPASNEASARVGSLRFTTECAYATPPPNTALTTSQFTAADGTPSVRPGSRPLLRLSSRTEQTGCHQPR